MSVGMLIYSRARTLKVSTMEKMESVLRRFHLIKEPRESDARQQLKRELFAFNKVHTEKSISKSIN